MKFRDDIQILRGLSVSFVVLFHFGFSFINSGFLGVDVFFVISGFLMAVLYDHNHKRYFFDRRAKRLIPPYFFVVISTVLVSFVMTTPNETKQVVEQSIFSSFFASNVGFWMQNSYFSKSEFNPLLHLWSLSVEIQFYLMIPFLSWFFRKWKYFYSLALFFSLALCLWAVTISPKTAFFMLPFRMWEFLMGFGAALYLTRKGQVICKPSKWIGIVSLSVLVLIPFFRVDGESLSFLLGHPGLFSFLVCLATVGVLIFGLPQYIENSFLGRCFVLIGKYSYSIYLVHFPVIVIYLSEPFSGTITSSSSIGDFFILVVSIFVLSWFSYNYIEKAKVTRIFVFTLMASFSAIAIPLVLTMLQGISLSKEEKFIFDAFNDRSEYRCGKLIRVFEPGAISCNKNDIVNPDSIIMLVGNSHADSIKTVFAKVAGENNARLVFLVSNEPMMKGGISVSEVLDEAISKNVDKIVIHYSTGGFPVDNVIDLIRRANNKGIDAVVIEPVPVWSDNIPLKMYESLMGNGMPLGKGVDGYLEDNEHIFKKLNHLKSKKFYRVSVSDVFCDEVCSFSDNIGVPYYFDSNHLTLTGASMLEDKFNSIFLGPSKRLNSEK